MRCANLTETWTALRDWLDKAGVLILPRLDRDGSTVRLDADLDQSRPATADEVNRVVGLLKAVIEGFRAPAVYVARTAWDPADETVEPGTGPGPGSLAIVTVRVMGGGVVHELTMVAAWYAALLATDAESTAMTGWSRRLPNRNSDLWPAA